MSCILRAEAACVDITPPVGAPQAGYVGRERSSETIDHELFGKVSDTRERYLPETDEESKG